LANSIIVSIGHKNAEKLRHNKNSTTYTTDKEIRGKAAGTVSLEKCVSPFLALSLNKWAEPSQRPAAKNVCKTRECNYSF
jgi:hypothetical protein